MGDADSPPRPQPQAENRLPVVVRQRDDGLELTPLIDQANTGFADIGNARRTARLHARALEDLGYSLQPSVGPHPGIGGQALTAAFRSVDLDDTAARQAAEAQRHVQRDRAGRDHLDRHPRLLTEAHDRALAELPLDLEESGIQGLLPVARPLRARLAVHCHGDSLPGLGACGHLPHRPGRLSFGPAGLPPAVIGGHATRRLRHFRPAPRGTWPGGSSQPFSPAFKASDHHHSTTIERTCIRS